MNIVYMNEHVKCYLTKHSPVSSYGIPALRVEGEGFEDSPDFGPSDVFSTGTSAAGLCCLTYHLQDEETRILSKSFCAQWPEGPQPELDLFEDPTTVKEFVETLKSESES